MSGKPLVPPAELLPSDVAGWVVRINAATGRTVAAVVWLGREYTSAKVALKGQRGAWGQLLAELHVNDRKVQRLVAIASHPVLANPSHATDLPESYTTL